MEGHVGLLEPLAVHPRHGLFELGGKAVELGDGLGAGLVRAEGGGLALYGRARVVEVYHVQQVHVRDVKTAGLGLRFHKADGLEPVYRLDDRRARDAQIGGYLVNVELGGGGYIQHDDLVVEYLRDDLAELGKGVFFKVVFELFPVHCKKITSSAISAILPSFCTKKDSICHSQFTTIPPDYQDVRTIFPNAQILS